MKLWRRFAKLHPVKGEIADHVLDVVTRFPRRNGLDKKERVVLMVYARQPFAKIAGTAIIGRQQANDRPVDQRFVEQTVDICLPDLQIAPRVEK